MSLEQYCDVLYRCIEALPPEVVIHRLSGDGPKRLLIAPAWSGDKKRVLNTIRRGMEERDVRQGTGVGPPRANTGGRRKKQPQTRKK